MIGIQKSPGQQNSTGKSEPFGTPFLPCTVGHFPYETFLTSSGIFLTTSHTFSTLADTIPTYPDTFCQHLTTWQSLAIWIEHSLGRIAGTFFVCLESRWPLEVNCLGKIFLFYAIISTRRYSPLRGPTSSSCGGLLPSAEAFFALRAKKEHCMLFWPIFGV